jgi:hypothetical protein
MVLGQLEMRILCCRHLEISSLGSSGRLMYFYTVQIDMFDVQVGNCLMYRVVIV